MFGRFRKYNVTVNLKKSKFFQPEVKFLEHTNSTKGIQMDPVKIKAVMEFERPKTRKDVQSYIGFLNFYRKYINRFVEKKQPLTKFLKKDKG